MDLNATADRYEQWRMALGADRFATLDLDPNPSLVAELERLDYQLRTVESMLRLLVPSAA